MIFDVDKGRKRVLSSILDIPDDKVNVHPVGGNMRDTTESFKAVASQAG